LDYLDDRVEGQTSLKLELRVAAKMGDEVHSLC
jgi:hypothetical protein